MRKIRKIKISSSKISETVAQRFVLVKLVRNIAPRRLEINTYVPTVKSNIKSLYVAYKKCEQNLPMYLLTRLET